MEHFGKYLRGRAIKEGITLRFEGCSANDISEIMKAQNVKRLPRIFREYLEILGKQGILGPLRSGLWRCKDLKELKRSFIEEIKINGFDFQVPSDAFVSWTHEYYRLLYFLTENTDENPPVYLWEESGEDDGYKSTLCKESIKDLLIEELEMLIKRSQGKLW